MIQFKTTFCLFKWFFSALVIKLKSYKNKQDDVLFAPFLLIETEAGKMFHTTDSTLYYSQVDSLWKIKLMIIALKIQMYNLCQNFENWSKDIWIRFKSHQTYKLFKWWWTWDRLCFPIIVLIANKRFPLCLSLLPFLIHSQWNRRNIPINQTHKFNWHVLLKILVSICQIKEQNTSVNLHKIHF